MHINYSFRFLLVSICAAFSSQTMAQLSWEVIQIPMRDGRNLIADLYLPNDIDTFPVVFVQTPYGKNFSRTAGLPLGIWHDLPKSPFAFVVMDWRCRFASIGACNPDAERGEDGYDAVEWIASQPWCNGKIGTVGPSALGNVQYQTAREQPPHLICAIPEVASPQFNYQQYLPGGVLRAEYFKTLSWLFPGSGFDLMVANPYYNLIWQIAEASTMYPEDITIPMFLVGGWYDHNLVDNLIMMDTLQRASDPDVRDQHKILIGPWVHGGTGDGYLGSLEQGQLTYPEADGFNHEFSRQFMEYYLLGMDNGWENQSRYTFFQMGDNKWHQAGTWPPNNVKNEELFFTSNQLLTVEPATVNDAYAYLYDPEEPSPTIGGKTLSLDLDQGPFDQSVVEDRNDNVVLSTTPLSSPLPIQGKIKVELYFASDRPDTDVILRLTDVYPDGRSMLLSESVLRMRFREGFRVIDTVFMREGEIYPVMLEFDDVAHTFLPGHRLRLIISSSNYPNLNRNMNNGGEMYPDNNPDTLIDPLIATNQVWYGPASPSKIILPVQESLTSTRTLNVKSTAVTVLPNPASSRIEIKDIPHNAKILVFDHSGRLCLQKSNWSGQKVDISHLPSGIYLLRAEESSGKIYLGKFMVQR